MDVYNWLAIGYHVCNKQLFFFKRPTYVLNLKISEEIFIMQISQKFFTTSIILLWALWIQMAILYHPL